MNGKHHIEKEGMIRRVFNIIITISLYLTEETCERNRLKLACNIGRRK